MLLMAFNLLGRADNQLVIAANSPTPCTVVAPAGWQPRRVQPQQTVAEIAAHVGVDAAVLLDANCLTSGPIAPGQLILAPIASNTPTLIVRPPLMITSSLTPMAHLNTASTAFPPPLVIATMIVSPTWAFTPTPLTSITETTGSMAPASSAADTVTAMATPVPTLVTLPVGNLAPTRPPAAPRRTPPLTEIADGWSLEQRGMVITLLVVVALLLVYLMARTGLTGVTGALPLLTLAAHLLFLLGGFLLGLLVYPHFRLPSLVDLPMPVAAGSAILLLVLLTIRELILPLEGRWKPVRQLLNVLIVPLLTFFFLMAGARIAVLLQ